MNKILSGLLTAGLLATFAQADVIRAEMGAGVWQNEFSGNIASANAAGNVITTFDTALLGYKKETKPYVWINFKHPVPALPNLRLEYTSLDYSGTSTQSFTYKGVTYNASASSKLTLDQYDLIMYYNILDNTMWATLDVGLDIKLIESEFSAVDNIGGNSVYVKETLPVPMGYARIRAEIPGTDIGIEGDMKYSAYKNSKIMDYRVKLDYTVVDFFPVDVGLELGYRFEGVDIDGNDFSIDTTADVEIDGIFFGAFIKF